MTARATLKQADYKRIFKAAKMAGVRVKLGPDGSVEMLTESGAEQQEGTLRRKVFSRG